MNEDKQKPQVVNPPPPPTEVPAISNGSQFAQQPMSRVEIEQSSVLEKPKLIKSLLTFLVITFWLAFGLLGLVLGDIQAGVLRGEPETGWGILIGFFLIGPPLLIFGLISLIRIRRLRLNGQKIGRTVKMAFIITVCLVVISLIYSLAMSKYEDYASKDRKAAGQLQKELNASKVIDITEATNLLNECKLIALYSEDVIKSEEIKSLLSDPKNDIVLVRVAGNPYNIQVSNRVKDKVLPIAEASKKNCPKFSINGS